MASSWNHDNHCLGQRTYFFWKSLTYQLLVCFNHVLQQGRFLDEHHNFYKNNLPIPQKTSKFPSPKLTWQTKIDSSDVGLKSINIHQSGQCTGHLPGNQGYACTDGATEASDFFWIFQQFRMITQDSIPDCLLVQKRSYQSELCRSQDFRAKQNWLMCVTAQSCSASAKVWPFNTTLPLDNSIGTISTSSIAIWGT